MSRCTTSFLLVCSTPCEPNYLLPYLFTLAVVNRDREGYNKRSTKHISRTPAFFTTNYSLHLRTVHQYLDKYPIDPCSERVIVGTIHPHDTVSFKIPFFYGSRLSLWELLDKASGGEIGKPISLEGVLRFLHHHKISMSDTVRECRRISTTWADNDLIPIRLNTELLDQIRHSAIREVLFMSGFGKNNAFKLFYVDMLGQRITPKIRKEREVILEPSVFGRPVKLTILYSPSGAANIALAQSEIYRNNKQNYVFSPTPVYDFKVDYYREKFHLGSRYIATQ